MTPHFLSSVNVPPYHVVWITSLIDPRHLLSCNTQYSICYHGTHNILATMQRALYILFL
jgi:hypothetical protein